MRILAINWLDIDNPDAGGAELHFFEIFRRLVTRGHPVTLVTSGWQGADPTTEIDRIRILRFGNRYSFALRARRAVRKVLAGSDFDVVVEDINKLPLFLPTLTNLPVYVIVPHLFGAAAFGEAAFPIALTVWLAEQPIPYVYRRSAFHAISESTRDDLIARGVDESAVEVVYPGVDKEWYHRDQSVDRAADPTFLYIGRLKRYKGVDTAIHAIAILRRQFGPATLQIAGSGDDRPRLEQLARSLGVSDSVEFLGFVSEAEKRDLMRRTWAVIFPSAKEGWGLTNIEAAACGTPGVAADSPGLRETVVDGRTGILFPYGDSDALASCLDRLCRSADLRAELGAGAVGFAATFSWEEASERTEAHLRRYLLNKSESR